MIARAAKKGVGLVMSPYRRDQWIPVPYKGSGRMVGASPEEEPRSLAAKGWGQCVQVKRAGLVMSTKEGGPRGT